MCTQGFGFELLDRMLGVHRGHCGSCCEPVKCCREVCRKVWVRCPEYECCPVTVCKKVKVCETVVCKVAVCKTVCEDVQVQVCVTKCVPECRTETFCVNVCRQVPCTGTRTVRVCVPYEETVTCTRMVQRQVCREVADNCGNGCGSCDSGCNSCGHGHRVGGLFQGLFGGHRSNGDCCR